MPQINNKYWCIILSLLLFPLWAITQTGIDTGKIVQDSPTSQKKQLAPVIQNPVPPTDTLKTVADSNIVVSDSLKPAPLVHPSVNKMKQLMEQLRNHPYYNFFGKPVSLISEERNDAGSEVFFYLLLGMIFYYALVRAFFPKYEANLFTLFFRATLRQQQLREQLLQSPLPSLFLNILFVLSGSLYISFLARYEGVLQQLDFWLLWLYAMGALAGIYIGKFLVIKTIGWILRFTKASDAYIFVVFMVNKMTGIFLLPVLLLMAFPSESLLPVVVTLSLIMLVVLLAYRFLISYRVVRNEIKVNPFHFFIYLCAFEIAPLLLIYKVLLNIVERTI